MSEVSAKKQDEQKDAAKVEEPKVPPISLVSSLLFFLRVAVLSVFVICCVILFLGWRNLAADSATMSPSSLPAAIATHMERGTFVPVFDGSRSLNLFASYVGASKGSEETVLLLHRIPGSSLSFSTAQARLESHGIASLALDLPGFGLSDKPQVAYTLDYLAQAAVDALTSLHIDKVHLVGVGESCFVATRIAERFRHVVSSIALHDCEVPPTRPPSLAFFAFEHSPALPALVHSLLFGQPNDESAAVAAANRWLTVYKNGQKSYFSFCSSAGGARFLGEDPLNGFCEHRNCAIGGLRYGSLPKGILSLNDSLEFGERIAHFVEHLPAQVKQNKQHRPPPKVQYVQPTGDKYGVGAHGDHDHAGHDGHSGHAHEHGHIHGQGCNH